MFDEQLDVEDACDRNNPWNPAATAGRRGVGNIVLTVAPATRSTKEAPPG